MAPPKAASSAAKVKGKSPAQRLIIKLKVSSDILRQYAPSPEQVKSLATPENTKSSSSSTPIPQVTSNRSTDTASESNSTPAPPAAPGTSAPIIANGGPSRKGIPGPKPGAKRGSAAGIEGIPKPRGKPGPKKKPRLEDGSIDHGEAGPPVRNTTSYAAALNGPKLGPKANQGAINAGLRALDRSGKPCRRWEKKGFKLKSFTGVVWQIPTWRTPKPLDGSSSADGSPTNPSHGDSDSKENKDSSEMSGGDPEILPSSPVAAALTPAS